MSEYGNTISKEAVFPFEMTDFMSQKSGNTVSVFTRTLTLKKRLLTNQFFSLYIIFKCSVNFQLTYQLLFLKVARILSHLTEQLL